MEIRILISIKAMLLIHNTGIMTIQKIDDWIPRLGVQNVTQISISNSAQLNLFTGPALKQLVIAPYKALQNRAKAKKNEAFLRYSMPRN
jgi:hypothetical protein